MSSELSQSRRAMSGLVAAISALAAGQLVSSLDTDGPTLIDAVGSGFIDQFAGTLKDLAVALFGVHHKTALIIGVWVVAAALGALSTLVRAPLTAAIWTAAALLGLGAHTSRPEASTIVSLASVGAALLVGLTVMWILTRQPDHDQSPTIPGEAAGDRRQFIALAGGTLAGSAAVVALGRVLHSRAPAVARVLSVPTPTETVPVPVSTGIETAGLSPYITPNDDFYRIDTALRIPRIDSSTWTLTIDGMVDQPLSITYDDLLAEEAVSIPVTIACVSNQIGGDLIGTAVWQGVPLERLLARCGVRPDASQIVSHSRDGFTAGMPTAVALDGRTSLIAYAMNGEPLPERHGFPARLIVSGLYGYVSATKWLTRIELTTMDAVDGYWIPRGWAKEAPVKLGSRIDVPARGDIDAGQAAIAGVAWSPSVGIDSVEVSIDDGKWRAAELGRVASDDTWVQWLYNWDAIPGDHTIAVRAIGANGEIQTDQVSSVAPDGATGHHRRKVTVR